MANNKRKTAALTTLGCKVNQYETASFISSFQEHGVEIVPFSKKADIYVINSCAVTGKAGSQSRQVIRRALRTNPKARILVTGCYAQVATQEILDIADHPICLVGNDNKHLLVDIALSKQLCDLEIYAGDINRKKEISDLPVSNFSNRTRAFLKIQDGCDNFCTYCIVPFARGRSRSLTPAKVTEQLTTFANQGYQEVVITGIHLGMYGKDLSPVISLLDLFQILLDQNHKIRYRVSSLEPGELTDDLLSLLAGSNNFMPHFHLPLQSGDPHILKKMNRKYTVKQFEEVVHKIADIMPNAAIGLDVLTGFPGESEEMFHNTVKVIEKLPITYLHVFPFSKRPGTVAEKMPDQIPSKIKDSRVSLLKELDHKKRTAFYGRQLGTVQKVLSESRNNQFKMMKGFTENYVPVFFQAPSNIVNKEVQVKIERIMDQNVFGTLV